MAVNLLQTLRWWMVLSVKNLICLAIILKSNDWLVSFLILLNLKQALAFPASNRLTLPLL